MRTSPSAVRSALLALSLLVVGAAHAAGPVGAVAPQYQIKTPYAKRLIKSVATDVGAHNRWDVAFVAPPPGGPIGAGAIRSFVATPKWGPGPHIALAVPTITGTINVQKAPQAPKGKARVTANLPVY